MAEGSGRGYQSLSQLQNPPSAMRPSHARQVSGAAGGADLSAGGSRKYPQRPGKMGHLVRMASEVLLIPARTASYYEPQDRKPSRSVSYGTRSSSYGAVDNGYTRDESAVADDNDAGEGGAGDEDEEFEEDDYWGHWRLFLLTLGLAGATLLWSVELGFGTPMLLSLGLSSELTSLVWLAGPLAGLLVQPIIGAVSDNSSSRYRRRKWVVLTTILITLSALVLGFASELGAWLVDTVGRGAGDWDPTRKRDIQYTTIGLAVAAFYILDFSLNGIQAALRALVLDRVPSEHQTVANAYLARMTSIGNIVGYGVGYANLSQWKALRWVGGGQFRKLCIVAVIVLNVSVAITCITNPEERLPKKKRDKSMKTMFANIWKAAKDLPIPIRRICYVQLFSWSGWFAVMFYSSTWIAVRYYMDQPNNPPDEDTATRTGSLALLFQAIIATLASILLPIFQALGASEYILSRPAGKGWNLVRYFLSFWTPRNLWTGSHVFFVLAMAITFFVKTRQEATVIVASLGIPWAITCWVPFAILMEYIREMEAGAELNADEVISASAITLRHEEADRADGQSLLSVPGGRKSRSNSRRSSTRSTKSARARAQKALTDCTPLNEDAEAQEQPQAVGGTILGIHNLAIVAPQFITAVVAAAIFKVSEVAEKVGATESHGLESGADVVWVLRFGGLMSLFAVFLSRYVPAPPSEQTYVADLQYANEGHDDE